jgi:hypothetical protein
MGALEHVKDYGDLNSADVSTLKMAIEDMKRYAPAESYVLDMWSHGSSWLPGAPADWFSTRVSVKNDYRIEPAAVAQDASQEPDKQFMELDDFAEALPAGLFDYVIFDECYMSGIEVAYALKDKTKYIVASVAEILGIGMPYDKIMSGVFTADIQSSTENVARAYFDYFNAGKIDGWMYPSATIAVIDLSQIDDELVGIMREILSAHYGKIEYITSAEVQYYDRYSHHIIFDMGDFAHILCGDTDPLYSRLMTKLSAVVTYANTTEYVCDLRKDPARYSGIMCYIPFSQPQYSHLNELYKQDGWAQRVYPAVYLQ